MPRPMIEIDMHLCTLEEIGVAKKCARTLQDFVRLDTVEFLLRGYSRKEVESLRLLSSRTLRGLVSRFNQRGIDGVVTKASPGRARKLEREYFAEVAKEQLAKDCVTIVQLHGFLTEQEKKELSYSTCWRYTREAKYTLIVPRKTHPKAAPEQQEAFVAQFNNTIAKNPLRVFFVTR